MNKIQLLPKHLRINSVILGLYVSGDTRINIIVKLNLDVIEKWWLMDSPYMMLLILGAYLLFVLKLGPLYMKNRPAYKLRKLIIIYNVLQVAYSSYLFSIGIKTILSHGIVESDTCYMDVEELKHRITSGHYLYFIAKLTEFLDTVFFVLRKKWTQVSFLHVYHHALMYLAAWTTLKYEPSYSLIFLGTVNSFVHVIMYGYYGLSAFPKLRRYLWWKKYITKMQLIQFVAVAIQIQWNTIVTPCPMSYFLLTVCWVHAILFIYLFTDFYVKSYLQKRRESKATLVVHNLQKKGQLNENHSPKTVT